MAQPPRRASGSGFPAPAGRRNDRCVAPGFPPPRLSPARPPQAAHRSAPPWSAAARSAAWVCGGARSLIGRMLQACHPPHPSHVPHPQRLPPLASATHRQMALLPSISKANSVFDRYSAGTPAAPQRKSNWAYKVGTYASHPDFTPCLGKSVQDLRSQVFLEATGDCIIVPAGTVRKPAARAAHAPRTGSEPFPGSRHCRPKATAKKAHIVILEVWPESGGSRVSGYTWGQQV